MTTGICRGEVGALRWSRVDLDAGMIDVRRSYRLRYGVGTEKDTKTHQMRRIVLDNESVVLLAEHKRRCSRRLCDLGMELSEDMYVPPFVTTSGASQARAARYDYERSPPMVALGKIAPASPELSGLVLRRSPNTAHERIRPFWVEAHPVALIA